MPKDVYNPFGVLKDEVDDAITKRRTFTVRGCYPVIRQALIRRGWIEKVHASYRYGFFCFRLIQNPIYVTVLLFNDGFNDVAVTRTISCLYKMLCCSFLKRFWYVRHLYHIK